MRKTHSTYMDDVIIYSTGIRLLFPSNDNKTIPAKNVVAKQKVKSVGDNFGPTTYTEDVGCGGQDRGPLAFPYRGSIEPHCADRVLQVATRPRPTGSTCPTTSPRVSIIFLLDSPYSHKYMSFEQWI